MITKLDIYYFVGLALLSLGFYMIYIPAAPIVAGTVLLYTTVFRR